MDKEVSEIKERAFAGMVDKPLIAIVEHDDGTFEVYQQTPESVLPTSIYPTKRLAAARLLQLLHIGPVAPQTHPETVCIGSMMEGDGG